MVYGSVFKLVLLTKLDRTFLPSVQSSCKELHRRWFDCTATNFIGLGNPREITLHSEHHLLASNYLYVYVDIKHFSILELKNISFLKNHIFFYRSAISFLFRSLHGNSYNSSWKGKNPMIFKILFLN